MHLARDKTNATQDVQKHHGCRKLSPKHGFVRRDWGPKSTPRHHYELRKQNWKRTATQPNPSHTDTLFIEGPLIAHSSGQNRVVFFLV